MYATNYFVRSAFNYDDKPETIKHLKANSRDVIPAARKLVRLNQALWDHSRQPYGWNNIPFIHWKFFVVFERPLHIFLYFCNSFHVNNVLFFRKAHQFLKNNWNKHTVYDSFQMSEFPHTQTNDIKLKKYSCTMAPFMQFC